MAPNVSSLQVQREKPKEIKAPVHPSSELDSVVPADPRQSYDIREVIARVTDGSEFREFKQEYGKTVITVRRPLLDVENASDSTLTRRASPRSTATRESASRPSSIGSTADLTSQRRHRRQCRLCSQRGIPLVFLVNISGYMVGEKAERGGIAKDGAKMVRAVARAKVPKFTVIVGGSYG
jgi:3-methylcrotonyl-CoA carboxylase beta subunit